MLSIKDKNYYYEDGMPGNSYPVQKLNPGKSGFSFLGFLLIAVLIIGIAGIAGFLMKNKSSDTSNVSYNSVSDEQLQQLLENQEAQNAINQELLEQLEALKNQEAQNALNQELLEQLEALKNQENSSQNETVSLISDKVKTSYNDPWSIFTVKNNLTDNVGNFYETAYSLSAHDQKITYVLNGEYTSLSGNIAVDEGDRDCLGSVSVDIYDENNNHIYESEHITRDNPDPVYINCNVTGLERVTIQFNGCNTSGVGLVDLISEGFVVK